MFSNDAYGVTDTDPRLSDEIPYGDNPFAEPVNEVDADEPTADAIAA